VADVPRGLSPTPPHPTKLKKKDSARCVNALYILIYLDTGDMVDGSAGREMEPMFT
jgi:hypothetical protein